MFCVLIAFYPPPSSPSKTIRHYEFWECKSDPILSRMAGESVTQKCFSLEPGRTAIWLPRLQWKLNIIIVSGLCPLPSPEALLSASLLAVLAPPNISCLSFTQIFLQSPRSFIIHLFCELEALLFVAAEKASSFLPNVSSKNETKRWRRSYSWRCGVVYGTFLTKLM